MFYNYHIGSIATDKKERDSSFFFHLLARAGKIFAGGEKR